MDSSHERTAQHGFRQGSGVVPVIFQHLAGRGRGDELAMYRTARCIVVLSAIVGREEGYEEGESDAQGIAAGIGCDWFGGCSAIAFGGEALQRGTGKRWTSVRRASRRVEPAEGPSQRRNTGGFCDL